MGKLTIEQKAKRYDEILVKLQEAKVDNNVCDDRYCCVIDDIVPELKESEGEKWIPKEIAKYLKEKGGFRSCWLAWLEKQCGHAKFINGIQVGDKVTRNEDGVLVNLSQLNRVAKKDEKQCEQKHQYNSRPRYVGEEELLGTNKQGKCPFSKQELIDMGFAFTQDGDLAYPIHKIEKKEFAAWSEEDIKTLERIVCILDGIRYYNTVDSKQEKPYQSEIDWLNSLKDRFIWKPSGEQMDNK